MADVTERNSWFLFAVVIFIIAGVFNIIWGVAAFDEKPFLDENGLLAGSLETWGGVSVIFGVGQLVAAYLVWNNKMAGGVLAVMIAAVSAIFWFAVMPVLPFLAFTAILLDVLIMYGLIANASEFE
jgi:hypothetical protein